MNTLGKDFKAAFGSVWALIGVLISSVAVFNWLSGVLKIGLSALFAHLLGAFRSVFHPIIEFLTGWAIPWLPFLALPEWKDGLVLWLAIGGAVAKTSFLWVAARRLPGGLISSLNKEGPTWPIQGDLPSPIRILVWASAPIFWPTTLSLLWLRPIAVHAGTGWSKKSGSGKYVAYVAVSRAQEMSQTKVIHDLRVVFAMQLAAVIAVVVCLVLLNASGVG